MATIVNTPGGSTDGGAGGWIVAGAIVIVVALVAIFVWPGYGRPADTDDSAQINIQLPVGGDNSGPGTGPEAQ